LIGLTSLEEDKLDPAGGMLMGFVCEFGGGEEEEEEEEGEEHLATSLGFSFCFHKSTSLFPFASIIEDVLLPTCCVDACWEAIYRRKSILEQSNLIQGVLS
jgi:hypothetical protein